MPIKFLEVVYGETVKAFEVSLAIENRILESNKNAHNNLAVVSLVFFENRVGYRMTLMVPNNSVVEPGKMYVTLENNSIRYKVLCRKEVVEGIITSEELLGDIPLNNELPAFESIRDSILEITTKRGHTPTFKIAEAAFSEPRATYSRAIPANGHSEKIAMANAIMAAKSRLIPGFTDFRDINMDDIANSINFKKFHDALKINLKSVIVFTERAPCSIYGEQSCSNFLRKLLQNSNSMIVNTKNSKTPEALNDIVIAALNSYSKEQIINKLDNRLVEEAISRYEKYKLEFLLKSLEKKIQHKQASINLLKRRLKQEHKELQELAQEKKNIQERISSSNNNSSILHASLRANDTTPARTSVSEPSDRASRNQATTSRSKRPRT